MGRPDLNSHLMEGLHRATLHAEPSIILVRTATLMRPATFCCEELLYTLNCGIAPALGLGLGFGLAIAFAFNSTFRFFPGFIILEVGW